MVKKIFKYLGLSLTFLSLLSCETANSNDNVLTLHVYNWEDYIYIQEDEEDLPDVVTQFEDYINNNKPEGITQRIEVVYDTFDTPETMYNQMKLNKTDYDLMCPSDYMIQKLASNIDGLEQTKIQRIDYSKIPNYQKYTSHFLIDNLKNVDIENNEGTYNLYDYAVGYMWGTLGLLYNPYSQVLLDKGYTTKQIIDDFNSPDAWNLLWENKDYASVASIKDSIRDTYAMGLLHVYNDECESLRSDYENNVISKEEYKKSLNELFNRSDEETRKLVSKALIELKDNIYGFEVDTGKNDIVSGKVSVNLAWSGDAVYSMQLAEEDYGIDFYYALPSNGANIWFDGWCIPESCTGDKLTIAYEFLNFLADPEIAVQNMDYIGYTSFCAGDEILNYVHECYSAEEDEADVAYYDLSYFFEGTLEDESLSTTICCEADQIYRELHAQYPTIEEVDHLCIMKDFGVNNDAIVALWENVKVNPLPLWVTLLVVITLLLGILYLALMPIQRKIKLRKRRLLREK